MQQDEQRRARGITRSHCRACGRPTRHLFAGWATGDAHENTIRPRAYYRTCEDCGLLVLVLADVDDTEGLARFVLDERLRVLGGAATATQPPIGPPPTDWDAALNYLFEIAWLRYSRLWDPGYNVRFRAYAIGAMRHKLNSWLEDESGEASGRSKGRAHPKAHAASVSVSYDVLLDGIHDFRGDGHGDGIAHVHPLGGRTDDQHRLDTPDSGRARDVADDRSPDLARALAAPRR